MGWFSGLMKKYQSWVICLAFVLGSLVLYLRADHPTFLFDSAGSAIEQPGVRDLGAAWETYRGQAFTPGPNALGHFSFALSAWCNRVIGQPDFDVTTFLVTNALLHGVNSWLVFLLLGRLCPSVSVRVRAMLAMLFLLHPLQLTSVAYIMQRRGILATLFYLWGLLVYLRGSRSRREMGFQIVGVCGLYVLCFTSKAMGLTLPLMLVAIELLRRLPDTLRLKKGAPLMVLGVVVSLVVITTFLNSQGLLDVNAITLRMWGQQQFWGPGVHLLTEARAFVHYGLLMWLPVPGWMSIDHDFAVSRTVLEHGALWAILLHVALVGAAVMLARKGYLLIALGIAWFYVALIPYAVLPQVEVFVEYKTYLPMVGWILLLAGLCELLREKISVRPLTVVLGLWCVALACLSLTRASVFQSAEALWEDAMNKAPGKVRPMVDYATLRAKAGDQQHAIKLYQECSRAMRRRTIIWGIYW